MLNSIDIKTSLKREYDLCSSAMAYYRKALQELERKHQLSTNTFLKKFDSGQLGDDADYFDWYAYAKLHTRLKKTKSAIRSAIQ